MAALGRYPGHSHRVTRAAATRKVDDGLTRAVVRWFFGGGAVHELDGTAPGSAAATARLSALRILAGVIAAGGNIVALFASVRRWAGSAAGSSLAGAALGAVRSLAAMASAWSETRAPLECLRRLTGAVAAIGGTDGKLFVARAMAAVSAGWSALFGALLSGALLSKARSALERTFFARRDVRKLMVGNEDRTLRVRIETRTIDQ